MVNALLSIVLLSTQVLSWNASPMFLCLGPDGSICVDLGPVSCACCRPDPADTNCCESEHAGHDDHFRFDWSDRADFDPCGCTHVQISEPQSATLTRVTEVPDAHRLVSSLALSNELASACCDLATSQTALRLRPPDYVSGSLGELSSIVLRC